MLTPRRGTFPKFVSYLCQSAPFTDRVTAESVGIAYPAISETNLRTFRVCVPPLPEQAAIVRFLDHVDRRIRRYVRAKQKLIAVLEEQKQVFIQQAVTGRIDVRTGRPYSAYKNSGVEYMGIVPAHWTIAQLRRMAVDYCDGPFGSGLKSSHYTEDGVRVVRLQNIGHGEFVESDTAFISREHYLSLGDHSVISGDILIAGLGDDNHPAGRACVAPKNIDPAMVKADCFRFRPDRDRVDPKFVALQLTATAVSASAVLSAGATRQRTNLRSTSTRAVSIPTMHEQTGIVEYVTHRIMSIDVALESTVQQIAFLREYRTRLIADVVTGKLDVREAAAGLPDVDSAAVGDDVDDGDPAEAPGVPDPERAAAGAEHDAAADVMLDERNHPAGREERA